MHLTISDIRGVPGPVARAHRGSLGGGRSAAGPHEERIAADPFKGGFRVLIAGITSKAPSFQDR